MSPIYVSRKPETGERRVSGIAAEAQEHITSVLKQIENVQAWRPRYATSGKPQPTGAGESVRSESLHCGRSNSRTSHCTKPIVRMSLIGLTSGALWAQSYTTTTVAGDVKLTPAARAAAVIPLSITPTALPNATLGQRYAASIQASGGTLPYTWSVNSGALPTGLALTLGSTINTT